MHANRGVKNLTKLMFYNMSNIKGLTDTQTSPNRLKKYEPARWAGEGEEEYAQIRERSISVARRCLGNGKAEDKLVLNAAACYVLNTKEEKHEVPMEMEEHGARDDMEEISKIPCSSKTNEEFSKENKHTFYFNSRSNSRTSNNCGNPDLCSLPETDSKSVSTQKKHFNINPSL